LLFADNVITRGVKKYGNMNIVLDKVEECTQKERIYYELPLAVRFTLIKNRTLIFTD